MDRKIHLAKRFLELTKKLDKLVSEASCENNLDEIERLLAKREDVMNDMALAGGSGNETYHEIVAEAEQLNRRLISNYQACLDVFSAKLKEVQGQKKNVILGSKVSRKYQQPHISGGHFIDKKK